MKKEDRYRIMQELLLGKDNSKPRPNNKSIPKQNPWDFMNDERLKADPSGNTWEYLKWIEKNNLGK